MDIIRAKEIVHALADGVDPRTGEILPEESVYNSPEVIRALFTLLERVNIDEQANTNLKKDPLRNAGKPWTFEEDEQLRNEFLSEVKISEMAEIHGRTKGAIESRLDHIGLQKRPFWLFRKKKT